MTQLPQDIHKAMVGMGFMATEDPVIAESLTGGVASDIWRVQLPTQTVCVKKALAELKVTQAWQVPVDRNAFEVAWFNTVLQIAPDAAPRILGHDAEAGIFVMEFLPPQQFKVWKSLLQAGVVKTETAQTLAEVLAGIHGRTAGDKKVAQQFATDDLFFSLRPEPYLLATARHHPDVANHLQQLADTTMANQKALVHGDISPKNILVGDDGPKIIDAECAWYGDPAFDLAFCLNHLLLKCLWNPSIADRYLHCFEVMTQTYLAAVNWESPADIEQRMAHLLPGLMLGRVDGKSPVEYITEKQDKEKIRQLAKHFLRTPTAQLSNICDSWEKALKSETMIDRSIQ